MHINKDIKGYLSISEVAKKFAITPRTLRFYEDKNLIEPLHYQRKRFYNNKDITRIKLILRGKRLGFSLDEIGEILDLYETEPGEKLQLEVLLNKIKTRRQELEQKLKDTKTIIKELKVLEENCRVHIQTITEP